jgi:hypothetical protein
MVATMEIEENNGKEGFLSGNPSILTWAMPQQATPRDQ